MAKYTDRYHVVLARVVREEPVAGIKTVTLELIRDEDTVELHDNDEFVTVLMKTDPWKEPNASG